MIIILGAMDSEIDSFLSALQNRCDIDWKGFVHYQGTLEGHEVLISKSGVGKVMAAMMTQHLIDAYQPQAVLFTGLAGGLSPLLAVGDTLLARDLVQHDLTCEALGIPRGQIPFSDWRYIPADQALLTQAGDYQPRIGQLHIGRICTGDQFITHREMDSHQYLFDELQGDAVEMEGASVAQVCAINQIPCLIARTISDRADGSAAQDFSAFLPQASLNSLALVRHLLRKME